MGGLRAHYLGIRIRHIYAVLCWYLRLEMTGWRAQTKRGGGSLLLVAVEESCVCECVAAEGGNKSASPSSPSGRSVISFHGYSARNEKQQRGAKNSVYHRHLFQDRKQ